ERDTEREKEQGEKIEKEEGEKGAEKEFTQDVLDSLNAALSLGEIPQEKILMMVLEINSSKREYNISMDRMSSLIFIAFLRLHNNHKFSTLKQRIDNYTQLLCKYYSTRSAQNGLLKGLNEVYASNRGLFSPIVAKIIHHLFEVDILEEESILEWHGNLDPKDPIKDLVGVLIDWLNE
ncbi:hypothetical protein PENTCL1PPCAC_27441, partial [Pristionchus entomophagus]